MFITLRFFFDNFHRYCEVEKLSNERESTLITLRTAADNNESRLCGELKLLSQQKEEMELNYKRLQWQLSDNQMEKEKEVEKYVFDKQFIFSYSGIYILFNFMLSCPKFCFLDFSNSFSDIVRR